MLVAGYGLMLPEELKGLAKSSLAATFFVSNFFFYFDSTYFSQAAIFKPLLHTWSLAVEEQYYIFWPLVLWLIVRFIPGRIMLATLVMAFLSLLLASVAILRFESLTFYMLPMRAWELLVGAIIPISGWTPRRWRETTAWAGVAMILAAVFLYTEQTLFPGLAAVPPVLGTALILSVAEGTSLARILSTLPLRAIGLISYSLYLWHWPVLAFFRLVLGPTLPTAVAIGCIAIAIFGAAISWRFVEQPFRRPASEVGDRRKALVTAGALMAVFTALGLVFMDGFAGRLPPQVAAIAAAAAKPDPNAFPCWVADGANPDAVACLAQPDGKRQIVALWGDSHVRPFVGPLKQRIGGDVDLRVIGRGGCMPLAGVMPEAKGRLDRTCDALNRSTLDALTQSPDIKTVMIVGRWARLHFPEGSEEAQRLVDSSGTPRSTDEALSQSFATILGRLTKKGKRVIILGDVPEFVLPAPGCLARAVWHGRDTSSCTHAPLTLPDSTSDLSLHRMAAQFSGKASFIWPASALCDRLSCQITLGGLPISRDTDHLTDAAADFVITRTGLDQTLSKSNPTVMDAAKPNVNVQR